MFKKKFWIESTERALKTFAQVVLVVAGGASLNVLTVDWKSLIGLGLGGVVLSYATSIVSSGIGPKNSPSLVK